MPGRAGGSRGSAPSIPYLNEARPTTISSEGISGRRGAPTGAKVRVVTFVIFQDFFLGLNSTESLCHLKYFVETFLSMNPYKIYNQKI